MTLGCLAFGELGSFHSAPYGGGVAGKGWTKSSVGREIASAWVLGLERIDTCTMLTGAHGGWRVKSCMGYALR